ncbi:hypothetical protein HG536_0C03670 [Torulaspora globosa]|uniref:Roadblock/LAMTOR2 domain-containing protein n=1 Tax=Torulaspora globosa TaxID=48254 RepID=A0A7G3ZFB3_9SACH|nr:uncharacterized protein HG536_0C03670 [Torulaspora globosa]QLL32199.1 hypothetical protein HG536_0C03670 [Torulaspora globosa]
MWVCLCVFVCVRRLSRNMSVPRRKKPSGSLQAFYTASSNSSNESGHKDAVTMVIQSRNVRELLQTLLKPVRIDAVSFTTSPLQSAVLLASTNGSVISFASSDTTKQDNHSVNNLKMMSLLIRDKWSVDESLANDRSSPVETRYRHKIESEEDGKLFSDIYTYEIEDLHACVAQIPQSELLLLFIAETGYPYGLLKLKMQKALLAFKDMYGYKLG